MFLILILLLLLELPLTSSICVKCASPTLMNQWQLTGLPTYPAGLPFTPFCNTIAYDEKPEKITDDIKVASCSTMCFEMAIPFANEYHIVRGCHDEFIEAGATDQQASSGEKCTFSRVSDQHIVFEDGTQVPGVAAIHFTKIDVEKKIINAKINARTMDSVDPDFIDDLNCTENRAVNCVKSMYYDGTGEDNNKNSCTGGYCTSIEGRLNGRKYIERGCAPISPYTQPTCVTMHTNSTFASGPGNGGPLSREKRSLIAILNATECFCSTEYCNTSPTYQHLLLVLASVILAATARFLY